MSRKLIKLVLTGGPGGGKTQGQEKLTKFMKEKGWVVYLVPEAATIIGSGQVKFADLSPDALVMTQENILRTALQLEHNMFALAELAEHNTMVIMDRGALDGAAYVSHSQWIDILGNTGYTEEDLLGRYDIVVHLETAAKGADKFYSIAGHVARHEGSVTKIEGGADFVLKKGDQPHKHFATQIYGSNSARDTF